MSSTLGKRKTLEDNEEHDISHGSTLFVSNLPYTATSVDLQTLFSDMAPVRSAFVVTEHGTGNSKGVGYVSFSAKEDAQMASEQISKNGLNLAGRSVRVQWAEKKDKAKEDPTKNASKPRPPQRPTHPHDPNAIRTIVVSGLPNGIDDKVLWKKVRKYEGAEKVDWPIKVNGQSDDPTTAHVLFSTPGQALIAIQKLHAHVYKGSLLSVSLKKRLDGLSKVATLSVKKGAAVAPSNASRLIVRNIPFDATEQDLRAVFLPHGSIYSVTIPTADDGKGKGFGFVWFYSKKDAERAVDGCNGQVVRTGMANELVGDKQKRKKARREERKAKTGNVSADEPTEKDGGAAEDGKKSAERVIAVDWALSKDRWEEERVKQAEDVEMASMGESSRAGGESSGASSDSESDSKDGLGVHSDDEDEDSESNEDGQDEDEDDQTPAKPQLPPPEAGTTLFVRNVPYSSDEDDLRTLFRAFGPLRYARITMDPATGRSKGTGFACFWNKADADKVIAQSDILREETVGQSSSASEPQPTKKNPFTLQQSVLTPDPSSSMAQTLVLHGRTLDVVRAVTRDVATKLRDDNERRREKADKRNMYLLREGVIFPNAPAAQTVSSSELERRQSSFNARKNLLRSNPSLYVSKTRLSVRQIPLFVTERGLKRLAVHAKRAYEDEVKEGNRNGLSREELLVDTDDEDAENVDKKGKKFKGKAAGRDTGVRQAKIVRQQERVDPITGKGKSKGYGFIEMRTHADALRVLRYANNNPAIWNLFLDWWKEELRDLIKSEKAKSKESKGDGARFKRYQSELEDLEQGRRKKERGTLIVEFSIENVQVVKRRKEIAEVAKEKSKRQKRDVETKEKQKEEDPDRPVKKRRKIEKQETPDETPKHGRTIGSIIGRKRKERQKGKKSVH